MKKELKKSELETVIGGITIKDGDLFIYPAEEVEVKGYGVSQVKFAKAYYAPKPCAGKARAAKDRAVEAAIK